MTTAVEKSKEQEEFGQDLIAEGATLRRTQTQFTTAIAVVKPRERSQIIRACEEEAILAGDEFYYAWTVKTKQGPKLVEGLSIDAALAAARHWGNCVVPGCEIREQENCYFFTASFLDLETGFNIQRVFRQRKQPNIGMKDTERAEDIVFQIGQSKAIRNVVLNALPSWLTSKMLTKAKENIIAKIEKMGLDVARKKTVDFFAKYSVTVEQIEEKVGRKQAAWDAETLALLQGAMNSLLTGQESADSLFPPAGAEIAAKTGAKADELERKLKQAKTPSLAETDLSNARGGTSEELPQENLPSPSELTKQIQQLTHELKISRPSVLFEAVIGKGKVLDETGPEEQMRYLKFLEGCKKGKNSFEWNEKKAKYDITEKLM